MTDIADLAGRLGECVVPLERPDADTLDDLRSIGETLATRRVVALGEATHGTKEFFDLKRRLVQFLVTERDLRALGLEANFGAARRVDRYVVDGEGSPEAAVEALSYWTCATEEMCELVEWLREYNEERPRSERVRVYGFDLRSTRGPARALRSFLERVDPDYLDEVRPHFAELDADWLGQGRESTPDQVLAAKTLGEKLSERFERREEAYRSAVGDREWRLARRRRRLIEQAHEFATAALLDDHPSPDAVRDAAMAENVRWILDHAPGERLALWAHNGHVTTGTGMFGHGDEGGTATSPTTMGDHLRREYGDEYYALGFEFGRGSFVAVSDPTSDDDPVIRPHSMETGPDGSLPAVLDATDERVCFLDLSSPPEDPTVSAWVDRESCLHNVGAVYHSDSEKNYASVAPRRAFDGLIFVAETTPSNPVGGG
ncbi:erythromycin esterase family protein [Halorussus salinus]|uniref:erythromycin esterase family protein n=1 Tax=Halorussus salinus TaxID=1364935 RepID=UPI00138F0E02|nr:erythromycin esterase family protein [Halorussus salinus]